MVAIAVSPGVVFQRTLVSSTCWLTSTCNFRSFHDQKCRRFPSAVFALRHEALNRDSRVLGVWQPVQRVRRSVLRKAADKPSLGQEPVRSVSVLDGEIEGVIQAEREELPQPSWGRIYALGAGDVMFLLIFSAIGRLSHGFPAIDWDTVRTADPFLAGWFLGSYFAGGYGPEGQGLEGLRMASLAAIKSWAMGLPIALAIRGFSVGHVPPIPFIVVSLASTFVLQVGWRTAFTAVLPNDAKSLQKKMGNRKGGVLEFLQLLSSLVKRW